MAISKIKELPPLADLRERFVYDPSTGSITWARNGYRNVVRAGDSATIKSGPRFKVSIGYTQFMAHRVAWKLYYGTEPPAVIDHVNGNPFDNRIDNLREATTLTNGRNRNREARSTTGVNGVIACKQTGMFRAHIRLDGKLKCLGRYRTVEEAASARLSAEAIHFGEFASQNREAYHGH